MYGKTLTTVLLSASLALAPTLALVGCGGSGGAQQSVQEAESEPAFIDGQALSIIARGFEARQEVASKYPEASATSYRECVNAELDSDRVLRSAMWQDAKLQEICLSYINSLDAQLEVLDNYTMSSGDFYVKWDEAYNNRTKILKTLVEDYGLKVDDKWQSTLDELVSNGKAAEKQDAAKEALEGLVSNATWEKSDEYGTYIYTAVIENTSEYDFANISLIINLYDSDDVKTEAYASANSWRKGEKVKFEAYGNDVDAQRVEALVTYYEVS